MNLPKPKLQAVEVPEWDQTVYIRKMSGSSRIDWQTENYRLSDEGKDPQAVTENIQARLLVRCLCDENGKLLFSIAEAVELGEQDYDVIERIYEVAAPLNGIGTEAVADAEKK